MLIAQSTYHYLITNWGYQPALAYSTWEIIVQLIFIGLSTFVCQIFFLNRQVCEHWYVPPPQLHADSILNRIWVFSERNIPIVGSILAICLATFGLHILVTVQLLQIPLISEIGTKKTEIIGVFTLGAAGMVALRSYDNNTLWLIILFFFQCTADILIAGFLCYYLLRDQSDFHQACASNHLIFWLIRLYFDCRTKSLIGKILQYAVGAGLATRSVKKKKKAVEFCPVIDAKWHVVRWRLLPSLLWVSYSLSLLL